MCDCSAGYFMFDSPDAGLIASLLPTVVHVRGCRATVVAGATRCRRIERTALGPRARADATRRGAAHRSAALDLGQRRAAGPAARLGRCANRARHAPDARGSLALRGRWSSSPRKRASRAPAFFEHFTRTVGLPPMEYLLAWRMAVAKDLLRRQKLALTEVAERVGYGSASTFSTAFSRYVGQAPGRWRAHAPIPSCNR